MIKCDKFDWLMVAIFMAVICISMKIGSFVGREIVQETTSVFKHRTLEQMQEMNQDTINKMEME